MSGIESWIHRGDAVREEGCTLRDSTTNVSHTVKITLNGQEKTTFGKLNSLSEE